MRFSKEGPCNTVAHHHKYPEHCRGEFSRHRYMGIWVLMQQSFGGISLWGLRGPSFLIMEHIELSSFAGKIYNILAQESLRNLASVSEVCPKQCQKIPGSKPYFSPTLLLGTAEMKNGLREINLRRTIEMLSESLNFSGFRKILMNITGISWEQLSIIKFIFLF